VFVGLENCDPELNVDLSGTEITGECTIYLNCEQCSTQLKEAACDVYVDVAEHFENVDESDEFEISQEDATETDWYVGRKGAPMRYQKHYWGADLEFVVQRTRSEEYLEQHPGTDDTDEVTISERVGEPGSCFEEVY
jgi:hypothetical protein